MDAAAARISTRQYALLTREQALGVGMTDARQYEIWHNGVFVAQVDLAYPPFRGHGARRVPVARRPAPGRNRVEAAGWRLLEAAPEDVDDLVAGAAAIVRRAA